MAIKTSYNYNDIDRPYNNNLERNESGIVGYFADLQTQTSSNNITSPAQIGERALSGQSFSDIWIDNWLKSKSYKPKTSGFLIDGRRGYIECMQLYVGPNGIIGGTLNVPDETTANSWHVDSTGNMWAGCNVADFAADPDNADAYVLNTGGAKFSNITITGGTVNWSTVSGTANAPDDNATVGAIFGTNISGGSTGTNYVNNNGYVTTITGTSITTGTLNASLCNVTNLNADNITTGTLTGRVVKTTNNGYGNPYVMLDTDGLVVYGETITFATANDLSVGSLGGNSSQNLAIVAWPGGVEIHGNTSIALYSGSGVTTDHNFYPTTNHTLSVGTSSYAFQSLYADTHYFTKSGATTKYLQLNASSGIDCNTDFYASGTISSGKFQLPVGTNVY